MITLKNVLINKSANSKEEVLKIIAAHANELGMTNNQELLVTDLKHREEESSTGFTKGIAIPHTQSESIVKPGIIVVKLNEAIDYQSMDGLKTNFFISILVGKENAGDHLKILQQLSRKMVSEEFCDELVASNDEQEIFNLISEALTSEEHHEQTIVKNSGKKIIAVCACPMGLAHTFMAAEVIENYAIEHGHQYKIETQGADGITNYLTDEDINSANVIIHAIAVTPQDNERFEGHNINEVGLQELIKNPKVLLDRFMQNENGGTPEEQIARAAKINKDNIKSTSNPVWVEISKHLMSGISYMIPILVMGGLLGAIALLIPYMLMGIDPEMSIEAALLTGQFSGFQEALLHFCYIVQGFGFTLFGFAIPVFAAFCAYSIGGKSAWPIGFIGGYVAIKPVAHAVIENGEVIAKVPVASGFMGAVLIAFFAGYLVKYLNKKIKVGPNWLAFKTTFLIPLIAAFSTMIIMVYIITPIGGGLNMIIESALLAAGEAGVMAYSILLAAATAFDLGGPVNKAAGFVALGFTTEHLLPITARCIAIVVPSIGLGLATILDQLIVGQRVYDSQYKQIGKTSIFLAFMGISEGAIPFALERPAFVIPINMIGAVLGAVVAVSLGAVQWFPESAIWAWPMIDGIGAYILGIAVGSLFIAISNIYYRKRLIEKGKLRVTQ